MRRHAIHDAFILRQRPQGEKNAGLLLLTRDQAQLWVQAFGLKSPKSTLKAVCQPFNLVRAYVQHDPVKQLDRLMDAELLRDALDLRGQMRGIYVAAYFAELLERTPLHPGEDWSWHLLDEILRGSAEPGLPPEGFRRLFCLGIWKYLGATGFVDEARESLQLGRMEGLPPGVVQYLEYAAGGSLERGVAVGFDPGALLLLGRVLNAQLEALLGHRLRTFESPQLLGF